MDNEVIFVRLRSFCKEIKRSFKQFQMIDRFLIVMMIVLLLQMLVGILLEEGSSTNEIDVISRTTAASIFGYFLSSNFTSNCVPKENCTVSKDPKRDAISSKCKTQQVLIVGIFGLCVLVMLFLVRYLVEDQTPAQATISQLRDFVSGSVGFLLGSPGKQKKQSDTENKG